MARSNFEAFKQTIDQRFMGHPIVTDNAYAAWFARGEMTIEDLRHFTVQFSVFSNQFLLAALNRVINADSLQAARESKEILMNELGVIYNPRRSHGDESGRGSSDEMRTGGSLDANSHGDRDPDDDDTALVSTEGTVEGGQFRFRAAHFEWLLRFSQPLGLSFDEMGKRRHGTPTTVFFCRELFCLYGSDDYNEAMGAAFAVENWAAAGFWKQLIAGLETIKREKVPGLSLAFFTWHDRIEEQHKAHVWDELNECYQSSKFREEAFIRAGVKMLDGVKVFWDGLDNDRKDHGAVRIAS